MSISDQRGPELQALCNDHTPVTGAAPADSQREMDQLRARLAEFAAARRQRLQGILDAADAICGGADSPASRWRSAVQGLADDASRILPGITSGLNNPSPAAVALQYRVGVEEAKFVQPLLAAAAPQRWAALLALVQEVRTFDGALTARWQALQEQAQSVHQMQGTTFDRLQEAVARRAERSTLQQGTVADHWQKAAQQITSLSTGANAQGWHEQAHRALADASNTIRLSLSDANHDVASWRELQSQILSAQAQLQSLQAVETQTLHPLFRQARRECEDFCTNPAPERARQLLRDTDEALSAWASSQASSALSSEAQELARSCGARAVQIVADVERAWADFRRNQDGVFIGSLSSAAREALWHTSAWADRARNWANLLPRIEALRPLLANRWGVDAAAPFEALRKAAQHRLDAQETAFAEAQNHENTLNSLYASAREELFRRCRDDGAFDAFVVDHFSDVCRDYYDGMTAIEQANRLFERHGPDTVLPKAREVWERLHPFDEKDLPTHRWAYEVSERDREVLLRSAKGDAELEALAIDHFAQAARNFTNTMTGRQKAALILAIYGADEVLPKAQQYFQKLHPFDEKDLPTRPDKYPVSESERDWLNQRFATDAGLEAFAIDFFRGAFLDFGSNMSRTQKCGLMIGRFGLGAIKSKLTEYPGYMKT